VHLVVGVRSGFHHLVVEFEDHTMVVDAPSGWLEFHQLPAKEGTPGATSGSVAERLIAAATRIAPGKPVRYVALTHAHGDHAGGIRALVAEGATVLGTREVRPVVEGAVRARHTRHPDRLARSPQPLKFEVVRGRHVVEDDSMTVELIEVGPNPHARGLLVVHLPKQRLLYQADLFFPSGMIFPEESRLPVMQFFTRWLADSGLDPERIYSIHGSARVTPEQIAIIRARSDATGS
jgi:glyoxylase-like metal-dependent hydrolase (beta-lactamase superfamily II)